MILDFNPEIVNRLEHWKTAKFIGFWAAHPSTLQGPYGYDPYEGLNLPRPQDYVDETWNPVVREFVAAYLDNAPDVEHWRGSSSCRFCRCNNGSTDKSDGTYTWPAGFSHYVRAHGVKPPDEFIEHVRRVSLNPRG